MNGLKAFAPHGPSRIRSRGLLQEFLQANLAFAINCRKPLRHDCGTKLSGLPANESSQYVQIMDFAEEVLGALQVPLPDLIALWQKILDHITEALDSNARAVPCDATAPRRACW